MGSSANGSRRWSASVYASTQLATSLLDRKLADRRSDRASSCWPGLRVGRAGKLGQLAARNKIKLKGSKVGDADRFARTERMLSQIGWLAGWVKERSSTADISAAER